MEPMTWTSWLIIYVIVGMAFGMMEVRVHRVGQERMVEELGQEIADRCKQDVIDEIILLFRVIMSWPTYILEYLNFARKSD